MLYHSSQKKLEKGNVIPTLENLVRKNRAATFVCLSITNICILGLGIVVLRMKLYDTLHQYNLNQGPEKTLVRSSRQAYFAAWRMNFNVN